MMTYDVTSMRRHYHEILRQIVLEGRETAPRGMATREVAPALIRLSNPLDSLPLATGRGVVKALACVEALSLIAGEADPRLFVAASPHYAKFVDWESGKLEVAYGPRIDAQMAWAESRLRQDQSSRQAHVDFWRPALDGPGQRAYPCVVSCGFTVRDGELDMFLEMRSNDAWLGLPYDMFAFTQLQATLASVLGVPEGRYHHYARSLHLYEEHWPRVADLADDPRGADWEPTFYGVSGTDWADARSRAQALLRGETPPGGMTESEVAYALVMIEVLEKASQ